MKKLIISLFALCLILCSCTAIENADIPPREEPTPSAQPEITTAPEPTTEPSPSSEPIIVPETLEELSEITGARVFSPKELPEGYATSQIGYDGHGTAAIKLISEEGTLFYTFQKGQSSAPAGSEENTVFGFTAYYKSNDISSILQWTRCGVTYQIISEPPKSLKEMKLLMRVMLDSPAVSENEINTEYESAAALSEVISFDVKEPNYIPEGFKLSGFYLYRLYSSSVRYISEGDIIVFKKCEGDISPAFSTKKYTDPSEISIGTDTVTVYKNEAGKIILAQWFDGSYTRQIVSENGIKESSLELIVTGFSN